jgi:hypothetical protein
MATSKRNAPKPKIRKTLPGGGGGGYSDYAPSYSGAVTGGGKASNITRIRQTPNSAKTAKGIKSARATIKSIKQVKQKVANKKVYYHGSNADISVGATTKGIRPGGTSATKNIKIAVNYANTRKILKSDTPKLYALKPTDKLIKKGKDINKGEVRGKFTVVGSVNVTPGKSTQQLKKDLKKQVRKNK